MLIDIPCMYEACMSPLMEVQRFKNSGVIEIHDGITFDFYIGLSHIVHPQLSENSPDNNIHRYFTVH